MQCFLFHAFLILIDGEFAQVYHLSSLPNKIKMYLTIPLMHYDFFRVFLFLIDRECLSKTIKCVPFASKQEQYLTTSTMQYFFFCAFFVLTECECLPKSITCFTSSSKQNQYVTISTMQYFFFRAFLILIDRECLPKTIKCVPFFVKTRAVCNNSLNAMLFLSCLLDFDSR